MLYRFFGSIAGFLLRNSAEAFELYNLHDDPFQKNDLAKEFPQKVSELEKIMFAERVHSEVFTFWPENR